ncbi:MAG TPA: NAD(P)/FAD-dependent oxidoreductase [Thermoanaerobaculia bacterium]|nr:NAD(P)/FAD-dependent oxidoreductase [Thermoanaerobaculia bacterium]
MSDRFDLVVVGAGPAGSSAALRAARAGLRTLLLDRATFPRRKTCGDALGGRAVAALRELGLLEEVRRLPGVLVHRVLFTSPEGTELSIDLARAARPDLVTGFVIRREVLDAFLLGKAREAAAEVREGFQVDEVVREGGAVRGVRGRDLATGARREFQADVVLGADGAHSAVARSLGLFRRDRRRTVVATRAYYRGVGGVGDRIELHYLEDVSPGYLWIFPVEDGLANVGIGMLAAPMRRRRVHLVRCLESALVSPRFASRFSGAERVAAPEGADLPVGGSRRVASGAGFLLAGDAAGLVDPFTGEGIANAMWSGLLAAETVVEASRERDFGARSLARYEERLDEGIREELRVAARVQAVARLRPLLDFTIRRAARSPRVRDAICAMIAGTLPRRTLTNPLFYARLLRA